MRVLPLASCVLFLFACSSSSSSSTSNDYDSLFSTAQAPSPDATKAIGLWELSQQQMGGGVTITQLSRLDIRDGTVKLAARCTSDGYQPVTAGVTASVTIQPDAIVVNSGGGTAVQTASPPAGKPAFECGVELGQGKLAYTLTGGKLQISTGSFSKVAD